MYDSRKRWKRMQSRCLVESRDVHDGEENRRGRWRNKMGFLVTLTLRQVECSCRMKEHELDTQQIQIET